jgi:hypothetical protein
MDEDVIAGITTCTRMFIDRRCPTEAMCLCALYKRFARMDPAPFRGAGQFAAFAERLCRDRGLTS